MHPAGLILLGSLYPDSVNTGGVGRWRELFGEGHRVGFKWFGENRCVENKISVDQSVYFEMGSSLVDISKQQNPISNFELSAHASFHSLTEKLGEGRMVLQNKSHNLQAQPKYNRNFLFHGDKPFCTMVTKKPSAIFCYITSTVRQGNNLWVNCRSCCLWNFPLWLLQFSHDYQIFGYSFCW